MRPPFVVSVLGMALPKGSVEEFVSFFNRDVVDDALLPAIKNGFGFAVSMFFIKGFVETDGVEVRAG